MSATWLCQKETVKFFFLVNRWKFSIRKFKKKESYAEVTKLSRKNKSSIHEIVKEKCIHPNFVGPCQLAKVTATAHNKCLVK